ncbi:hypothetical protein [Mycobacterium sp. SM1]|nr:hypothetical protein [Mycobacterium sp. SM1]
MVDDRADRPVSRTERLMSVVAYTLLTVGVFALLGWAQRLVERL